MYQISRHSCKTHECIMQEQLEAAHQQMTEQQRSNLVKMEKQGWEAADWKARALDSTQKLAAANAQVHFVLYCMPFTALWHCLGVGSLMSSP